MRYLLKKACLKPASPSATEVKLDKLQKKFSLEKNSLLLEQQLLEEPAVK